jgi:hypothetical protein
LGVGLKPKKSQNPTGAQNRGRIPIVYLEKRSLFLLGNFRNPFQNQEFFCVKLPIIPN